MSDGTQKAVAINVQRWQWNACQIGSGKDEVRILQTDMYGRPNIIECLIHHRFAITFISGRTCKEPVCHHVVHDLWRNAVFPDQRKRFGLSDNSSTQSKIVGQFYGGCSVGLNACFERPPSQQSKQRLAFLNCFGWSCRDDSELT